MCTSFLQPKLLDRPGDALDNCNDVQMARIAAFRAANGLHHPTHSHTNIELVDVDEVRICDVEYVRELNKLAACVVNGILWSNGLAQDLGLLTHWSSLVPGSVATDGHLEAQHHLLTRAIDLLSAANVNYKKFP